MKRIAMSGVLLAVAVVSAVVTVGEDRPEEEKSIEEKTRIHRLSSNKRSIYDAFVYVNRIPDKVAEGESAEDFSARVFSRLANQEGRILLKAPNGMNREAYRGFKTFLQYEGAAIVGNCAACHTPPEFSDLKSHIVTPGGSPKPTPSLRNLDERRVDVRNVLLDKIDASRKKRADNADKIADAYAAMIINDKDIPNLVAFLKLLNDVSDKEFRDLILSAKVLDTTNEQ